MAEDSRTESWNGRPDLTCPRPESSHKILHRIIKDETDAQCRVCGQYEETEHIIAGCPEVANRVYQSTQQSSSLPALEDLQGTQDQDSW